MTDPPARPLAALGKSMPVRLVDKPDATQSTILVLGPGIRHADPQYYAVRLMNYTLGGGGFSSRLMKVVRSEGGKTYGVALAASTPGATPGRSKPRRSRATPRRRRRCA